MPKEVIRGPGAPAGDGSGLIVYPVVEVRWGAGEVQLVTRQVDDAGDPYVRRLEPIEVLPIPEGVVGIPGPEYMGELLQAEGISGGMFVSLDRRSCNELVTAVRRARDKTYGRDA